MTVVRLDEDDLDEEDRAILAEVSKKGYYHGRPKNEAGPPPAKIEPETPQKLEASSSTNSRTAYDDFQRKWDRFDDDTYLKKVERETLKSSQKASISSPSVLMRPPNPPFVAEFKVVLVGDAGVGKSALVKSHLTGEWERKWIPSIEEEVKQLRFHTNCGHVGLNVWTVASGTASSGQSARERVYLQGHAAIVMFDVTSRSSFRSTREWRREVRQALGRVPVVMLGNKIDAATRKVTPKQIHDVVTGLQYYDVSVRDKSNFERPFLWLLRRLADQPQLQFVGTHKAPSQPSAAGAAAAQHRKLLQQAVSETVECGSTI